MPYETTTHNGRLHSRWIPDGAVKIKEKNGLGVVYYYTKGTKSIVLAFAGNSHKSAFHISFKSPADASKRVRDFFDGLQQHKESVAKYRRESLAPHTLAVGDIITNSWGYDQTNVDWYRVASVTPNFVNLKPIACNYEETGNMSGREMPARDAAGKLIDLDKPIERHKVRRYNGAPSVCFKHGAGRKWDGKPQYSSWYA